MKLLRKRSSRYIINVLVFLILSFLILKYPETPKYNEKPRIGEDTSTPIFRNFKPNKQNPDPPNHANNKANSFYTLIFDDVYEPKDYHCIMYDQWIDSLIDSELVDGIEIYSLNGWKHPKCKLSTVTVPPPPVKMYDPTSWQMLKSLEMFLERSQSNWLFLVGDAAYIRVPKFLSFMAETMRNNRGSVAKGGCVEVRYFFQMLELASGIVLSREAVEKIVALDTHWNVSIRTEMNGEQALGHALNNIRMHVPWLHTNGFVGNAFYSSKDYKILAGGEFSKLNKCFVRDELKNPPPGTSGNCAKDSQKFRDVFSWAGGGKNNRKEFLENAETWLSAADDSVGVIWERRNPVLCLL